MSLSLKVSEPASRRRFRYDLHVRYDDTGQTVVYSDIRDESSRLLRLMWSVSRLFKKGRH